jgi:hypothetical protein
MLIFVVLMKSKIPLQRQFHWHMDERCFCCSRCEVLLFFICIILTKHFPCFQRALLGKPYQMHSGGRLSCSPGQQPGCAGSPQQRAAQHVKVCSFSLFFCQLKSEFINPTSIHYFPPPASSASAAAPFAYSSGATFASAFATPATANNDTFTLAFGTHCSLQFGTSNPGT